jgi:hypothetical protein
MSLLYDVYQAANRICLVIEDHDELWRNHYYLRQAWETLSGKLALFDAVHKSKEPELSEREVIERWLLRVDQQIRDHKHGIHPRTETDPKYADPIFLEVLRREWLPEE